MIKSLCIYILCYGVFYLASLWAPVFVVVLVFINTVLCCGVIFYEYAKNKALLTFGTVFNLQGWMYGNYYFFQSYMENIYLSEMDLFLQFLTAIAIVSFNIAYYGKIGAEKRAVEIADEYDYAMILKVAAALFAIGAGIEYYFLFHVVGFESFYYISRAQRSLLVSDGFSLLYLYIEFLILVCLLSLIVKLNYRSKYADLLFYLSLGLVSVNSLISMSRTQFAMFFLPVIFILYKYNKLSNRQVTLIGLGLLFIFSIWKGLLSNLVFGGDLQLSYQLDSELESWVKIGENIVRDLHNGTLGHLYGRSYMDAAINLIYPFTGIENLSAWYVRNYNYQLMSAGGGRGFSGVIEAYFNFNVFGCVGIYFLYGLFFKKLNALRFTGRNILLQAVFIAVFHKLFRSEAYAYWKTLYWLELLPIYLVFTCAAYFKRKS